MAKMVSILLVFSLMKLFLVDSFDITHRVEYNLAGVLSSDEENVKTNVKPTNFSTTTGRCIAVEATKEVGCSARKKSNLFQGLFKPICERHELCYKCGFALDIPSWLCDQMANIEMYQECWKSLDSASTRYTCARQRFVALKVLRENPYRTSDSHPEFILECQQKCVADYFNSSK